MRKAQQLEGWTVVKVETVMAVPTILTASLLLAQAAAGEKTR